MQSDRSVLPPERVEALLEGQRRLLALFHKARLSDVEAGMELLRAGERPAHIFRLQSGWAARELVLRDGRQALLGVLLPGDLVGLDGLFSARTPETVTALVPTVCRAVALGELERAMEQDPPLALRVAQLLDRERRHAATLAVRIGRCSARERLSGFIFDIYERLRAQGLVSGRSFRLPLTQQQIGNHLGLTVVHVNRMLRQLREEGIVMVRLSTAIILDLDRLRDIAEARRTLPRAEIAVRTVRPRVTTAAEPSGK